MERVRESIAELAFRVTIVSEEPGREYRSPRPAREDRSSLLPFPKQETYQTGGDERPQPVRRGQKVGRNDPCPCGSGKKYKHCCGRNA